MTPADELARLKARSASEGLTPTVLDAWRALAGAHPARPEVWVAYGQTLRAADRRDDAMAAFRRAASLAPDDAQGWYELAGLHLDIRQLDLAERALAHARVTRRTDPVLAALHAWTLNEQGASEDAGKLLAGVHQRFPDDLPIAVADAWLLPPVYRDTTDVAHWRDRLVDKLATLYQRNDAETADAESILRLTQSTFHLAYQARNDVDLLRGFHHWQARLLARALPDLAAPLPPRTRRGKPRVAFVSADLRRSTIGQYFGAWLERLDKGRFESVAVMTGPRRDDVTTRIAAAADQAVFANEGVAALARRLRALDCDIIIYPEIGMNPAFVLLADLRLARCQVAAWGHPTTTGATAIDAFLTCGDMEPDGADAHYGERLIRLPGIGTCYPAPPAVSALPRSRFGLSDTHRVYGCPQTAFKVHPDNDALFAELLRDPQAVLLLFQHESAVATRRLGERLTTALQRAGVPSRGQIKFLPPVSPEQFRSVLAMCDVVLDTLHFSGGNTSLDAIAAGVPLVTWPGEFMRGRQSMAMLQALDLAELVVGNAADYVATARRLAEDTALNQQTRRAIAQRRARLYEQQAPIDALMDALEILARQA